MTVTGIQKGGLYNHFKDKEELALQAFDHCCHIITQYIENALASKSTSKERLLAFIEAYCDLTTNTTLPGGCPLINVTVETSDGQSIKLQQRAQAAMQDLLKLVMDMISNGMRNNEIRPEADPYKAATLIISAIEGGLLMSKLFKDPSHIFSVKNYLIAYVENDLSAGSHAKIGNSSH
jgi:TetR/AcrR family transcriptional repressor of nem operon